MVRENELVKTAFSFCSEVMGELETLVVIFDKDLRKMKVFKHWTGLKLLFKDKVSSVLWGKLQREKSTTALAVQSHSLRMNLDQYPQCSQQCRIAQKHDGADLTLKSTYRSRAYTETSHRTVISPNHDIGQPKTLKTMSNKYFGVSCSQTLTSQSTTHVELNLDT